MIDVPAEEHLRTQVRAALKASGRKQVWIADKLDISTKYLSQMLTGRVSLPLGWAQQIAALCDARVLVFVTAPPGTPDREHRIRLDDLNSDDLDHLYDDLDRYAEVVGEMNETAVGQAKELDAAAATIAERTVEINRLTELAEQQKQRADQAEALLRRYVNLADVTHKYAAMGGHDNLGANLGCAGCTLRDQARTHLNRPEPTP